ncbi:MAG: 3-hydroxyacyl-CoA dehydrogenase NAD-binding domain-containing protein, partial [Solirubrobacterales bacterium]
LIERIGVVGAGTMGAGIAQLGCLGSFEVVLHDPDPQALASGADRLRAALAKGAGKGLWKPEDAARAEGRLETAGFDGLAGTDLVIEAAPEDLALKRSLFADLAETCGPSAILATNTSSIPVSEIAAEVDRPERVLGMHFFNPPALMRLVEVIAGERTAEPAIDAVTAVAHAMNREPVRAADAPGFIVNRCNRPFALEALRMLGEEVAGHAEIDRAIRDGGGYRMGPFELMDLIGVDVNLKVAQSFYSQRAEPRWEPHPIQEEMVAAGRLGRKAGRGFYSYEAGRKVEERLRSTGEATDRAIFERIACCLVNEATFAVSEGVAKPDDVDTAMKLGLNHPRGPFEWREELGAARIVTTLDALAENAGSEREAERYGVAERLRELA